MVPTEGNFCRKQSWRQLLVPFVTSWSSQGISCIPTSFTFQLSLTTAIFDCLVLVSMVRRPLLKWATTSWASLSFGEAIRLPVIPSLLEVSAYLEWITWRCCRVCHTFPPTSSTLTFNQRHMMPWSNGTSNESQRNYSQARITGAHSIPTFMPISHAPVIICRFLVVAYCSNPLSPIVHFLSCHIFYVCTQQL
ncbi:unnamed protein product [Mesocestoides corti]|uniref:Secreted protein n=1 Tax=Mesocestoides corti TaxID=53468 RepID=A0A0R3UC28_MESCO|nr:unnamed protein product [Mesocestoides corti]